MWGVQEQVLRPLLPLLPPTDIPWLPRCALTAVAPSATLTLAGTGWASAALPQPRRHSALR